MKTHDMVQLGVFWSLTNFQKSGVCSPVDSIVDSLHEEKLCMLQQGRECVYSKPTETYLYIREYIVQDCIVAFSQYIHSGRRDALGTTWDQHLPPPDPV